MTRTPTLRIGTAWYGERPRPAAPLSPRPLADTTTTAPALGAAVQAATTGMSARRSQGGPQ